MAYGMKVLNDKRNQRKENEYCTGRNVQIKIKERRYECVKNVSHFYWGHGRFPLLQSEKYKLNYQKFERQTKIDCSYLKYLCA